MILEPQPSRGSSNESASWCFAQSPESDALHENLSLTPQFKTYNRGLLNLRTTKTLEALPGLLPYLDAHGLFFSTDALGGTGRSKTAPSGGCHQTFNVPEAGAPTGWSKQAGYLYE